MKSSSIATWAILTTILALASLHRLVGGAAPAPERPTYRFITEVREAIKPSSQAIEAGFIDAKGNFVPDPNAKNARNLLGPGISGLPIHESEKRPVIALQTMPTSLNPKPEDCPCYEFRSDWLIKGGLAGANFVPEVGSKVISMAEYLKDYMPPPKFSVPPTSDELEAASKKMKAGKISLIIYNLPGRIDEVKELDKR
jgi:hypothetical protein